MDKYSHRLVIIILLLFSHIISIVISFWVGGLLVQQSQYRSRFNDDKIVVDDYLRAQRLDKKIEIHMSSDGYMYLSGTLEDNSDYDKLVHYINIEFGRKRSDFIVKHVHSDSKKP